MRSYRQTEKADVSRRLSALQQQSEAKVSKELGIHIAKLYDWKKAWGLQGKWFRHE